MQHGEKRLQEKRLSGRVGHVHIHLLALGDPVSVEDVKADGVAFPNMGLPKTQVNHLGQPLQFSAHPSVDIIEVHCRLFVDDLRELFADFSPRRRGVRIRKGQAGLNSSQPV